MKIIIKLNSKQRLIGIPMKTSLKTLLTLVLIAMTTLAYAQVPQLDNFRDPGQKGLNVFETPKGELTKYDGLRVRVGGDFALQLQGLTQDNDSTNLLDLGTNFNLPTANLNIDVQLDRGVRLHMRTYLSARHHTEAWVKGGYMQIDALDFISEGFLDNVMEFVTIRAGMDEYNYGDTHFRRSDNARALYNPFVGNYIMDSFSTEPFMEVTAQYNGIIGVLGLTNGRLNQNVKKPGDGGVVIFGKVGYDKQFNPDFRGRLTASFYNSGQDGTRDYLYGGDRSGSRYYMVMHTATSAGDFEPRFNPGFKYQTAFQINPFVQWKGVEFFGVFEMASNGDGDIGGSFTQLGAELLYRFGFGGKDNFYVGGRYNSVTGKTSDASNLDINISRTNLGFGWFMTENVLTKVEYMMQSYDGMVSTAANQGKYNGASINGLVIEAVISF